MRPRAAKLGRHLASCGVARTNRRPLCPDRLELLKYDPVVNQRVLFKEERIKK